MCESWFDVSNGRSGGVLRGGADGCIYEECGMEQKYSDACARKRAGVGVAGSLSLWFQNWARFRVTHGDRWKDSAPMLVLACSQEGVAGKRVTATSPCSDFMCPK